VEHGQDARADALARRDFEDRVRAGREQRLERVRPLRPQEERAERGGQCEAEVEVADRKQVLELGLGPQGLVETAAARTVAVAAGVVGEVLVAATVADGKVSAEAAGAAGKDVSRGLGLLSRQTQSGHVIAQHVGNGECGALAAGHVTW
jgi:hypothetical protein